MGLADRLRRAARALPAPQRLLTSVDMAIRSADHVATRSLDAVVALADAASAKWRPTPPSGTITQIAPTNITTWGVSDVNGAVDSHENGTFVDSCALMDAMGRDDRITGCLGTRVRALAGKSGVGFSLEPSQKGARQQATDLAKEIEGLWYYACPENVMSRLLRDAVMLGVAIARIHWDLVDGKRVPRLEPWDMRGVYWDWSIRRYRAIALEGIYTIDPYSGEWFVFEPGGYRSWMYGAIRCLGKLWIIRQMTYRDWARYSEKHGMPIVSIKEPTGHQWEKQKSGFWGRMKNLGAETTLRLPTDDKGYGFGVELIEAKARSEQAFKLLLDKLEVNVAVTLLGQNLSTEVQGGSHAAAQAHELIRLDYLDADAGTLSTNLREQVWKPFTRFNHPELDEEETPWPTWATKPPTDKKAKVDVVRVFIDLVKLQAEPAVRKLAPVNLTQLAMDLDVPLIEGFSSADEDAAPQVFKYHFDYGLLTKNEGRAIIGLPATADGNVVPMPLTSGKGEGLSVQALSTNASETQKAKARHAVEHLIKSGKLPDPNDVECADCGHTGADKVHHYDHYRGYSEDRLTDVHAVCVDCHRDRDGQNKPKEEKASALRRANARVVALATGGLGRRTVAGVEIVVDRPAGSSQEGIAADGTRWVRTYQVDYGFIPATLGGDGDEVDVFCGPDDSAETAYWIVQRKADGSFDEFKLMLGFASQADALACYLAHVPPQYLDTTFTMPVAALRALLGLAPSARAAALNGLSGRRR